MKFKNAMVGAGVAVLMMGSMAQAAVTKAAWGKTSDGKPVEIYTLSDADLTVRITTFGARVVSIEAPDKNGKRADVVLGYDSLKEYLAGNFYFGAIVGRVAGRLSSGSLQLDG